MSFLDINNSEYLSARITQQGRKAIAKGNFDISYFTIGDSEYNYEDSFKSLTGTTNFQSVFTPLDKDTYTKYPFKLDAVALSGTTTYGVPIQNYETTILRNPMGPAGFVSDNKPYSATYGTGTTIECLTDRVSYSSLSGGTSLTVTKTSGTTYADCEFITLSFDVFNISGSTQLITGSTNSFIYKLETITGAASGTTQTFTLDRPLPNVSGLTGYANVICNKCDNEFSTASDIDNCVPQLPDNEAQHNPWTLNVVWGKKPIGIKATDSGSNATRDLTGYTSNKYIGVKEYLGYGTSSGQTYNTGTTYNNSYGESITLLPEEQKAIAIVHYSEVGDIVNDPNRFFKYDDYISTNSDTTVATDYNGNYISDNSYFQVHIPFLLYHRSDSALSGATFNMGTTDRYVNSSVNTNLNIKYRDLIDQSSNKVGKVFVDKKTIVFDDEELVASLDYKSNRRYTLPAPKIGLSSPTGATYSISGSTNTMWVTYVFSGTTSTGATYNSLPCQYISKITGNTSSVSNVIINFSGTSFQHMQSVSDNVINGFVANKFFVLAQTGTTGNQPTNSAWKAIDFTSQLTLSNNNIVPSSLTGVTFTITSELYGSATTFDLSTHMGGLVTLSGRTASHFGDEQPFPGSVKLVRATDIEEMNFLVNLPSGKFATTQNPTHTGSTVNSTSTPTPMITEVALLNSDKVPMVVAKTSKPIARTGTQVFAVKLDF